MTKTTKKGNPSGPAKDAGKKPADQHEPVRESLRTYSADLVPLDDSERPLRAFVYALDEAQARQLVEEESAGSYRVRGVWPASDRPAVLALFEPNNLL